MVRQQVIFAEVINLNEVRIYAGKLKRRIPLAIAPSVQRMALEFKMVASDFIKEKIPADRRTKSGLADSFVIDEERRPNGTKVTVYNTKPYAPFIDLNDITVTGHSRKLSHEQIIDNTSLKEWFQRASTFYRRKRRIPEGTTIGMSGGHKSFHEHSIFSKYSRGIRFTDHAFEEVLKQLDDIKRDMIKEILKIK